MARICKFFGALLLVVTAAACGSNGSDASTASTTTATAPTNLSGSITVSAAASLTEAFTEIGTDFESRHPGTTVTLTFDSSGTLSDQIVSGAPVDVFASADEANMTKVADEDLIAGDPEAFARNALVVVTKPGNPEKVQKLADLADIGVVSLCAQDAPCGKFAADVLAKADVTIDEGSITRGQNAKATLAAVTEGDAVAGIVYVTDALAAGAGVETVEIPSDDNVVATYPIAVLADAGNGPVADAFVAYVMSADGQAVLADHGFLPPS